MQLSFVAPPFTGPLTGGTLFNLQLTAALSKRGLELAHYALDALPSALDADWVWVDSLYLAQVPRLRERVSARTRLGLLLHYLPSLLEQPDPRELSPIEANAIRSVDQVVAPSETLRRVVERFFPDVRCASCEPGVERVALRSPRARERTAVMVCNVTENKGVLELLRELAARVRPTDDFALEVIGRLDLERAYAAQCTQLTAADAWLREHVRWLGGLPRERTLERVARTSVLVSASRMESYGMALAEARAHATPVLARAGGHAAAHVAAESGGELAQDAGALAQALLSLMRAPAELAQRLTLAARNPPARSWSNAAQEFERICRDTRAAAAF